MPSWLEVEDLRTHMNLPESAVPGGSNIEMRMHNALNASMELIDSTTGHEWGTEEVLPARVREAALLQASRLFTRQTAPLGIAQVGTADGGQGMRLLARLDPDVELLLAAWSDFSAT